MVAVPQLSLAAELAATTAASQHVLYSAYATPVCFTQYVCEVQGLLTLLFFVLASSSQCISRRPSREEATFPFPSGDSIATLFHVPELEVGRETLSLGSYQHLIAPL